MVRRTLFFPIGITHRAGYPPLTQVERSVEALAAYLRDYFPNSSVGTAADRAGGTWSYDEVVHVLDTELKRAGPDDTVIVYWAGHGQAGAGSHRLLLSQHSLPTRELANWLLQCPARSVVCILDCCWSGDGLAEIVAEAKVIRDQQGDPYREDQTTTVIASARSEPSVEGAFVATMLDVLANGPDADVGPEHGWDEHTERITPAELVEAVRVRFDTDGLDQQATQVSLRNRDAGRFFPSVWHLRSRQADGREVDARSRARAMAEAELTTLGVPHPATWTAAGLAAHRPVVTATPGLDPPDRAYLLGILDDLRLALSAEALAWSLIDTMAYTEDALRSARRAVTEFDDSPIGRQFDLFHNAARARAGGAGMRPVEALVRFVARLAYACAADPDDSRLFGWAAARGMESHEVNRVLADVRQSPPVRRLVIDLRGDRTVQGELPRSASAQIFENNRAVGDRGDLDITPVTVAGVLDAVATLVSRARGETFHRVDVVVADSLILLDPSVVAVPRPYRPVRLGVRYPVSVRVGGRLCNGEDWPRLIEVYRALTGSRCALRSVDLDRAGDLYGELTTTPAAVVFSTVPGQVGQPPPDPLLDAVYASPVVVWPAGELTEPGRVAELVDRHWPEVPERVAQARWRRFGDAGHTGDTEDLCHLRHVWEDDQWVALARAIEEMEGHA